MAIDAYASQMTNVDPNVAAISAGFNELVPLISAALRLNQLDFIQPQMYNTWSGVETTAYAQKYAAQIVAGFSIANPSSGGAAFPVKVAPAQLLLGYPSTQKGAGSGYIDPSAVATMIANMSAHGLNVKGVMTWSIGWDQQAGWPFAKAMGSAPAPTPPSPTPPSPTPPSPTPPSPTPPSPGPGTTCHSISPQATDSWCNENCHHVPPNCPSTLCKCT